MGERRFYLRELAEYEYNSTMVKQQYTVTESELIQRFDEAMRAYHRGEDYIQVLLHGTEKEQPIILSRCEAPKPTRKEWEEWAEKKPHPFTYRTTPDKQIDFAAWHYATMYWFLTMPIVPME